MATTKMASVRLLYSAILLLVLDMTLSSDYQPPRHRFPEEYEAYYEAAPRKSKHRSHRVHTRVSYGGEEREGRHGPGPGHHGPGPHGPGRDIHVTHDVRHVVVKQKRRRRKRPHHHIPVPVPVPVSPVAGFEGSYAAVSGTPGRGSVHIVENVPALGGETVHVVNGHRVASPGYTPHVHVPPPVAQPIRPVVANVQPVVQHVQPVQPVVQAVQPVHPVQPVLRTIPRTVVQVQPVAAVQPTVIQARVPVQIPQTVVQIQPVAVAQPTVVQARVPVQNVLRTVPQTVVQTVAAAQPTVIQARVPVQNVLRTVPQTQVQTVVQQPQARTRNRRPLFDRHPLPKCVYINTDFVGNDLDPTGGGDARGIISGSARACKALCNDEDDCFFWTYRAGLNRDCYLKEGTPGKPVPESAVPRVGYVSGTKDNNCPCITSDTEEDEVCPIKEPRGLVYPWKGDDLDENFLTGGGLGAVGGVGGLGGLPIGWTRNGDQGDPAGIYTGGATLDPRLTGVLGNGLIGTGGLLGTGVVADGALGNTGLLGTTGVLAPTNGVLGTATAVLGTTPGLLGNTAVVGTNVLGTAPVVGTSTGLALEDEVRILRDQLDILTRRLDGS